MSTHFRFTNAAAGPSSFGRCSHTGWSACVQTSTTRHDTMVELVTRMMNLKKQQARAPKKQSPSAKQLLDQKLAITDNQIDALAYELYGLTENEIRIVEETR